MHTNLIGPRFPPLIKFYKKKPSWRDRKLTFQTITLKSVMPSSSKWVKKLGVMYILNSSSCLFKIHSVKCLFWNSATVNLLSSTMSYVWMTYSSSDMEINDSSDMFWSPSSFIISFSIAFSNQYIVFSKLCLLKQSSSISGLNISRLGSIKLCINLDI